MCAKFGALGQQLMITAISHPTTLVYTVIEPVLKTVYWCASHHDSRQL